MEGNIAEVQFYLNLILKDKECDNYVRNQVESINRRLRMIKTHINDEETL